MEETKVMTPMGIYAAMAAIAAEIGAIGKDKRCTQGANFAYRGIDDLYNALNPIMAKHGVFVLPIAGERTTETRQTQKGATIEVVVMRMTYKFCHADGSSVEAVTVGQAMDSGDKATNKAMAIAHKYAILQAFSIPTEDMEDPDAVAEQFAPREMQPRRQQQAQPQQRREPAQPRRPEPVRHAAPKSQGDGQVDMITDAQVKMLMALFNKCGMDVREVRLERVRGIVGRNITSCKELTKDEASTVIDVLQNGEKEQW